MLLTKAHKRSAFTLVELLVVVAILVLLTGITVAVLNTTMNTDRVRGGARQMQSAVLAARDRAAQARQRRGIRLVADPNDPTVVNSLVFIDAPDEYGDGSVRVGRRDDGGTATTYGSTVDGIADASDPTPGYGLIAVRGYNTGWRDLYNKGLLIPGARIEIPKDKAVYTIWIPPWYGPGSAPPYCVSNPNQTNGPELIFLTTDYPPSPAYAPFSGVAPAAPATLQGPDGAWGIAGVDDDNDGTVDNSSEYGWPNSDDLGDVNATGSLSYELTLAPAPIAGEQPLQFPSGIVIDLYYSDIPTAWYSQQSISSTAPVPSGWSIEVPDPSIPGNNIIRRYNTNMDIVFSPRGSVTGALSARGLLHLLLAEVKDTEQGLSPVASTGEKLLVTVFTRTGHVSTHPVNITPGGDPFSFAKSGAVAGK